MTCSFPADPRWSDMTCVAIQTLTLSLIARPRNLYLSVKLSQVKWYRIFWYKGRNFWAQSIYIKLATLILFHWLCISVLVDNRQGQTNKKAKNSKGNAACIAQGNLPTPSEKPLPSLIPVNLSSYFEMFSCNTKTGQN